MVKFAERNFFVPVPFVSNLAELNEQLKGCCELYLSHTQARQSQTVGERLKLEQSSLLPLPEYQPEVVGLSRSKPINPLLSSLRPIVIPFPLNMPSPHFG